MIAHVRSAIIKALFSVDVKPFDSEYKLHDNACKDGKVVVLGM